MHTPPLMQGGLHTWAMPPQTPPMQAWPIRQTRPHAPQLLTSVFTLISQPVTAFMSQLANPALHAATAQAPAWHAAVAFGRLHGIAHPPQLLTSVAKAASHPLTGAASQLPNGLLQGPTPHLPMRQPGCPLITFGQVVPHLPQFLTSLLRSTSHPVFTAPSQSSKPVLHVAIVQLPVAQPGTALA